MKHFELYLKTMHPGEQRMVTYDKEEDKPATFSIGSTTYKYIADVEEGELFYTINVDDAEDNFAEIDVTIYESKEDAVSVAKKMQESLDEEEDCGDYDFFVKAWEVGSDGFVAEV